MGVEKKGAWQYEVQYYRRPDGGLRSQRKLLYDLCPVCRKHKKRIRAVRCRRCYEKRSSRAKEAAILLARFIHAVRNGEPVKKSTVQYAELLTDYLGGNKDLAIREEEEGVLEESEEPENEEVEHG